MLCRFAFLAIPPLPSIDSAAGSPALFANFIGTTSESDFSSPFIIGVSSSPSRCGPPAGTRADGQAGDLPVPVQGACVYARFYDHAGSPERLRWRTQTSCLPLHRQRRHPDKVFYRGSMARLYVPLPTLRRHPHGCLRTAWGRCGSLFLHRGGLAPLLLAGFPAHLCKNAKRSPLSKFRPSRSPVFDYFWSGNGEKTPEIEMAMSFYTTSAGSRHVGKRPKQTFRKGQPAAVELRLSSEIGAENPRSPRNR